MYMDVETVGRCHILFHPPIHNRASDKSSDKYIEALFALLRR